MFKIFKIVFPLLFGLCFAFSSNADENPIIIRVVIDQTTGEVIHRTPAQIPLTCLLDDYAYLVVDYLENLGTVSVEIENQTTGEYNQTTMNALAGPALFPISGTSGHWTITFTLTSGVRYCGEFDI